MDEIELPWIEKYKPFILDDIYGNEDIIVRLKNMLLNKNLSNLIISGPSGVGKSCSIKCLIKEFLGSIYEDAVLELNGSEDRGINIIRGTIKLFAQKKLSLKEGFYKVIILDEADSLTPGSQQALRRIIENFSNTTRFIFICNNLNKIIEPLHSRSTMLYFKKLNNKNLWNMIYKICLKENIKYSKGGLDYITLISDGDMRQAIENLQNTYYCFKVIYKKNINEICNIPLKIRLKNVITYCKQKEYISLCKLLRDNYNLGYSIDDLINTLFEIIKETSSLTEEKKMEYIKEISISSIHINDGHINILQLYSLLSKLCNS